MAPCAHDAAVPGVPVDSCASVGQVPACRCCDGSNIEVSAVSGASVRGGVPADSTVVVEAVAGIGVSVSQVCDVVRGVTVPRVRFVVRWVPDDACAPDGQVPQ